MLKKIRTTLAIIFFSFITLLFLDFTGTAHLWFGWMAKVQFLPAVLAVNVAIIAILCVITLVFGRIYCSVICPLGVMQDIIGWIRTRRKKQRNHATFSPERRWLRYSILALFIIALVAGIGSFVALLAPYSSYGRIANNLFQPVYQWGNNVFASIAEHYDSYAFYSVDIWIKSLPTLIIASVTFAALIILAWKGGRTYCNTICPVGTTLSFLARFSFLKIKFNSDKCKKCGLCTKNCKSSCIDFKTQSVDYSRCVVCGNCISKCKFGALKYAFSGFPGKVGISGKSGNTGESGQSSSTDDSRRNFLATLGAVTVGAALAQSKKDVKKSIAAIEGKEIAQRTTPLTPPGSLSAKNMAQHCTGCQLCVSNCPNGVLRPSESLLTLMQPTMSFERGHCRPECTRCSEVCPAGAIQPISREEKSATQIGHAVWIRKNCLTQTDGAECGNCERHCPKGAIQMVPSKEGDWDSPFIPEVDEKLCIGCGACENVCPARPTAIYVEGYEEHRKILDAEPSDEMEADAPDAVPCVECGNCMPCPYGVDIPAILTYYNKCAREGKFPSTAQPEEDFQRTSRNFLIGYDRAVPRLNQANHCIGCGACVPNCPQEIDIPREMMLIDEFVESLKRKS